MKRAGVLFALTAAAAIASAPALAQETYYQDPERCVAAVTALDANGDGYVDASEVKSGDFEARVDTDQDKRISKKEVSIACQARVMRVLEASGK